MHNYWFMISFLVIFCSCVKTVEHVKDSQISFNNLAEKKTYEPNVSKCQDLAEALFDSKKQVVSPEDANAIELEFTWVVDDRTHNLTCFFKNAE